MSTFVCRKVTVYAIRGYAIDHALRYRLNPRQMANLVRSSDPSRHQRRTPIVVSAAFSLSRFYKAVAKNGHLHEA